MAGPRVTSRQRTRVRGRWLPGASLLVLVLAVQTVLSVRLVRADTAFEDEATYLWAGHLEWAHWLHGTSIPPFASYFSGAPVVYPPVAALADSLGGLAGARLLSLVFMLAATALLWGTARRLFGVRAAFFAAALFAVAGPTLHLGAFATYDALSVALTALAAWCVVRAGDGEGTGWMVAAGTALAVANAAAYASAVFDLVVLALALLTGWPPPADGGPAVRDPAGRGGGTGDCRVAGRRQRLPHRGAADHAGAGRRAGLPAVGAHRRLVVDRPDSGPGDMRGDHQFGQRPDWPRTSLLAVLAAAAVLGPLEQARLHTLASLNKHVGLGAWFAAIAAGYAVDRFVAVAPAGRSQAITCGACVVALVFPAAVGASQAWTFSTDWPNASSFIAILRPLADHGSGHLLVEDASIARYYLPAGSQWQRWSSTRNIVLPSGASTGGPASTVGVTGDGNAGVFAEFITRGYFSLVALNFADTTALDRRLAVQLRHDPRYRIADVVPYGTEILTGSHGTYVIWRYEPAP